MPQGPAYDLSQLHQPPSKDNAPGPLQRVSHEPIRLEDLYDAIQELTASIRQLSDAIAIYQWSQSYGPRRPSRQSDPSSIRPVGPYGQAPEDPSTGR